MRVKISYGMDLAEVPNKSAELIREACKDLRKSVIRLQMVSDALLDGEKDFDVLSREVSESRQLLTGADEVLMDAQSILEGLDAYYNGEQDVSEGRPIMDSSGDVNSSSTDTGEG